MFNSDVTQTYNHTDATTEIIIMLAGAFLLGCLLCWLLKKLFADNKQDQSIKQNIDNNGNAAVIRSEPQTLASSKKTSTPVSVTSSTTSYMKPKIDNLTKITGINSDIETELKSRGIKSYIDLRDSNPETIADTLNTQSGKSVVKQEARTWPHQASLAAKGDWDKLKEYQDFMLRSNRNAQKVRKESKDDLKKIEGIGPKIEEILNNNEIYTFKSLSNTSRDSLKSHLNNAGNRFKMHEPESWPHQAGMADRGEWEELAIYQEFMDGGREIPSASSSSQTERVEKTEDSTLTDQQKIQSEVNSSILDVEKVPSEDLKNIEGIGPKIEEVLNNNGIFTYKQLHQTDRDTIKSYLDSAGNQFKMHEPESWPHQAGMADRGEWEELKTYQDFMGGGREIPSASAFSDIDVPVQPIIDDVEADFKKEIEADGDGNVQSIAEPAHFKSNIANKSDDLKKIDGIGPKIQELLNKANIHTFEDLKNSNRDFIKGLLDEAGPQYRMHEPETWPLQARMAFNGEWEKLEEYQDVLMGGR